MADKNNTQASQDAKMVARNASKVAKKVAQKAAGKAAKKAVAKKAVGAFTVKIKVFIAAGIVAFMVFLIKVAILVVIPSSAILSATKLVTGAAEDFQGWLNEVQASFSVTAINAFEAIDDFFDSVYSFFTGDTTSDEIEDKINEVIKYGGRNTSGEETDYGNTINGETAIIYKYFLDEYVDIKRQAEAGNVPSISAEGQTFIDNNVGTLVAENSETTTTNDDGTTTVIKHEYDTSSIPVVGIYQGDDMGDFFKPVFYLMAADSLTQYDNAADDFAMNSLVILANDVSKTTFQIIPTAPTQFIEKVSAPTQFTEKVSSTTTTSGTTTTTTYTHSYQVNVPYRIGTTQNSINDIITKAGKDPVDDAGTIKATVQEMCNYYGAEMFPDDGTDGWGIVSFTGAPSSTTAGELTSPLGDEQAAAALAGIDLTGCPSGAAAVMDIIRNIDAYKVTGGEEAIPGQVRFQNQFCQRAIADIYMCAGFPRPSFKTALATLNGPGAVPTTTDSPPCSGYAVVATSPSSDAGHIAIYFKGTDGVEYIFESVGGHPQVDTFAHWKTYYGYRGYTNFGCF